ncbi:MAG TPA: alpha/beta hydrolase [Acidimicrobiaceae bacterium]|jgi:pimeloyl-ACP methyl ester carboxylesterase|nr:alpha/beta hydrolase [Acidimicrobiaceae bacterium]
MKTVVEKRLQIHGHEVTLREGGTGPALLFIHGMAGSSRTWRKVTADLVSDYHVIAPDLIGHGESAKPMGDYSLGAYASGLRDLLGLLGVERCTVIGQSLGGGVAMQLAYQHPELVERLVLVGSGGLGREVSWMLRILTLPGAELLMPLIFPPIAREIGTTLGSVLNRFGLLGAHTEEIWQAYASLTGVGNRHAFIKTLRSVIDPGGQSVSALDRVYLTAALPTMLVWGDRDPIIPVEHARRAHELMPGSRLEIIEGAGHFPHMENPEEFIALLRSFLSTTKVSPSTPAAYRKLLVQKAG